MEPRLDPPVEPERLADDELPVLEADVLLVDLSLKRLVDPRIAPRLVAPVPMEAFNALFAAPD